MLKLPPSLKASSCSKSFQFIFFTVLYSSFIKKTTPSHYLRWWDWDQYTSSQGNHTTKPRAIMVRQWSVGDQGWPPKLTIKDHLLDIDAFFDKPAKVKGSNKPKRRCKFCRYAVSFIFLIYYFSTYLFNTGKKESSKQLFVKLPPSVDILKLSTLYIKYSLN